MDRPYNPPDESTASELSVDTAEPVVCNTCALPITTPEAVFQMGDAVQVFTNPHGQVFDVVTVREATGIVAIGQPSRDFTWFPGYAWHVIACSQCNTHLGWYFSANEISLQPVSFYGLLRNRLVGL